MCIRFDLSTIDWTAIACFCAVVIPLYTQLKAKHDQKCAIKQDVVVYCNALVNNPTAYEYEDPNQWITICSVGYPLQEILMRAKLMHYNKYNDLLYYLNQVLQYQTGMGYKQAYCDLRTYCLNNIPDIKENSEFSK